MLSICLSNLALEAFGKYLSCIQKKLAALSEVTSVEIFNSEHLDPMCKKLEEIVQKSIPRNLADEVAENSMAHLVKTYNYLNNNESKRNLIPDLCREYSHFYKQITVRLCSAITHPLVKKFQFSLLQFPFLIGIETRIFKQDFLNTILNKIPNVRVLVLEIPDFNSDIVVENIKLMKNLEELTFFGCTDSIVEAVCESCNKLRYLDLSNSREITNFSMCSILRLRYLKHLKIERTRINSGWIKILFQMNWKIEVANLMQSLCCLLESSHVEFLPKCFPNLTTLEFYAHEHYNLIPLKELENLTNLGISFNIVHRSSWTCLEEFLQVIGRQLVYLKLTNFREKEFIAIFRIVAENCTKLESLVLKTIPLYVPLKESDLIAARNFPVMNSVTYCDIKVSYVRLLKAVLSKLVSLREIKCYSIDIEFKSFVIDLLLDMKAGKYDTLYVYGLALQNSGENIITRKDRSYGFVYWNNLGHFLDKMKRERYLWLRENPHRGGVRTFYP